MPRFHLHLNECGETHLDQEGGNFVDLDSAKVAAVKAARGIMCEELRKGHLCLGLFIEIDDEEGNHCASLSFSDAVTTIS